MKINWDAIGGRKYVITLAGVAMTAVLAKLNAPGDAYLALGGIIAAFSGANAWTTVRTAGATPSAAPIRGTPKRIPDSVDGIEYEPTARPPA